MSNETKKVVKAAAKKAPVTKEPVKKAPAKKAPVKDTDVLDKALAKITIKEDTTPHVSCGHKVEYTIGTQDDLDELLNDKDVQLSILTRLKGRLLELGCKATTLRTEIEHDALRGSYMLCVHGND